MSQWTHVLGVIRYDYMSQVCWYSGSKRKDGKPECYNPNSKVKLLRKLYKKNVPTGSEGPIEINVTNSHRGPIVILSGDLRDFGSSDVEEIFKWLEIVKAEVEKSNGTNFDDALMARDSVISIDVEFTPTYTVLIDNQKYFDIVKK